MGKQPNQLETLQGTVLVRSTNGETLLKSHTQIVIRLMYDMIRDIGSSVDSPATGKIFPYLVSGTLVQDLFHR